MEKERVKAEVYALLQTTDRLEALYGRGAISKDDVRRGQAPRSGMLVEPAPPPAPAIALRALPLPPTTELQYETHCRDLIHHFKLQEDALMRLCGMSSKEFIEKYK